MARYFLLCIYLLGTFCLQVFSQQSALKGRRVNVPSLHGFVSTAYTFVPVEGVNSTSPYLGFSYGTHYTHWFKNTYSVFTGLKLTRVSTFSEQDFPDTTIYRGPYKTPLFEPEKIRKTKYHFYYLSVPVNSKMFLGDKSPYYVFGGASFDFLFYQKSISKDYYDGRTESLSADRTVWITKPFSIGVNGAVGREYKTPAGFSVNVDIEFRLFSVARLGGLQGMPFYAGINLGIEFFSEKKAF